MVRCCIWLLCLYKVAITLFSSFLDNPADLGVWKNIYSGTVTYYDDRVLTVFTTYIYRVTAYNDYGYLTSEETVPVTTHGGQPSVPPSLSVITLSHLELYINWTVPSES